MDATWFIVSRWNNRIEKVTVERVSESSIWINGRRRAKVGAYENFFPTWEAAHEALLGRVAQNLEYARSALALAQGVHGNVLGMKKPEAA